MSRSNRYRAGFCHPVPQARNFLLTVLSFIFVLLLQVKHISTLDLHSILKNPLSILDFDTTSRFNFMILNDGQVSITPEVKSVVNELQISFYNVADFIAVQEATNSSFQFGYSNHSMTIVIISTINRSKLDYMINKIDNYYHYTTSLTTFYRRASPIRINDQLYFLIMWPDVIENETTMAEAMKSVSNVNFTISTNVYVCFPKIIMSKSKTERNLQHLLGNRLSEEDLVKSEARWQIWGLYSIKNVSLANLVLSSAYKEQKDQNCRTSFNLSDTKISLVPLYMNNKVQRRQNFHQMPITAVAVANEDYPFEVAFTPSSLQEGQNPQLESGFGVSLFRDLKFMMNFSERCTLADGFMSRGSDIHVKLESGEADICITQNVYIPQTYYISTVLQPTFPLKIMAFCEDPIYAIRSTIFINIFPRREWIAIGLIIVILMISVSICTWIRNAYLQDYSLEVKCIEDEVLVWGFAYFCQRSWHIFPSSWALKLIFFCATTFSLIIYSAYVGILVSRLSVHNPMLTSFQDLLDHNYSLAYNNNSVSMTYFVKGIIHFYRTPEPLALTFEQVETTVMEKKAMLLYYWDSLPSLFTSYQENIDQFLCNKILAFPVDRGFVQSGFVIKKGSPFKDIFNNKIIKIKEVGLNARYLSHYTINTQPTCFLKDRLHHLKLGVDETKMIFHIWSFSIILSLCLLFVETLGYRLWNAPMLNIHEIKD